MKLATAAATAAYLFLLIAATLMIMAAIGFVGWTLLSLVELIFF